MAVGYFRKIFVFDAWLGSGRYLLTFMYVSSVYILAASRYYSHVSACLMILI